ncbi:hypothetical protein Btru_026189 [Bulinus truncatus]|nr:hypothetical protein Btru_026189 [Bulinus truncatus]
MLKIHYNLNSVTHGDLVSTCMVRPNTMTESLTRLAEFTSMAVKDLQQALLHIQNVLNSCTVIGQSSGHHHVRIDCQSGSVFYSSPPAGLRLYNTAQLTSSSDEH